MNQLPGLILIIKSDHVAIMHIFQGINLYIRKLCLNSNSAISREQINAVQHETKVTKDVFFWSKQLQSRLSHTCHWQSSFTLVLAASAAGTSRSALWHLNQVIRDFSTQVNNLIAAKHIFIKEVTSEKLKETSMESISCNFLTWFTKLRWSNNIKQIYTT